MEILPNEVLLKICNLLSPRDVLGELKFVSRRLYAFTDAIGDRLTHPRIPICYLQADRCFYGDAQGRLIDTKLHLKTPDFLAKSRIGTFVIDGFEHGDFRLQTEFLGRIYAERVLFVWSGDKWPMNESEKSARIPYGPYLRSFGPYSAYPPSSSPSFYSGFHSGMYPDSPYHLPPTHPNTWLTGLAQHAHTINPPPPSTFHANHYMQPKRPRLTGAALTWASWVLEHLSAPRQFGLLQKRIGANHVEQIHYFLLPKGFSIRFADLQVKIDPPQTELPVIPLKIKTISQAAVFFETLENEALIHGQWSFDVELNPTAAVDFWQYVKNYKESPGTMRSPPKSANKKRKREEPVLEQLTPGIRIQIRPKKQRIDETVHRFIEKISGLL